MIEDRGTNGTQPLIGRPIESQSGTRWSRVVRWNPTVTWKYNNNNNNNNNNKTEHDSAPSRRERICGAILWFAVYSLGNLSTRFRKSTSNPIERDRPLLLPRRTSQSTCRKRRAQPIKRDRSRMNRMDRIQIFDIGIFNLFDLRRQALRKWNSFRWKRVEPIEWMKRNGLGRRNFFFIIIIFLKFVGRQDVGLGALRSCRSRLPHQVELEELVEWVELVQKSRQNKRKKQPPPSMPHFINFFSFFFAREGRFGFWVPRRTRNYRHLMYWISQWLLFKGQYRYDFFGRMSSFHGRCLPTLKSNIRSSSSYRCFSWTLP